MILENWGATPAEIAGAVVGDHLCPDARLVATRSITIAAPPAEVFPWIRQMGFGRAGWYSYDLVDNLGRRSTTEIHPEWQDVNTGDTVPGGPIDFEAALVDPPRAFVLRVVPRKQGPRALCFTLAYDLREDPEGTRLVTRMRARIGAPGGALVERLFLGPGDGIMLRRQLLGIARRANRPATAPDTRNSHSYPVAHTPPGGYGETFPPLVLPGCTEPLVEGAPDLRGIWRVVSATRGGVPVGPEDRLMSYRERIEQAGNRIVDCGGGTIADCRADGTEENGVHDVSAFDYVTPIHVVATYEDGVFVLRPVGIPGIEVTRRLDAEGRMVWTRPDMGGMVAILERVGPPE